MIYVPIGCSTRSDRERGGNRGKERDGKEGRGGLKEENEARRGWN